MMTKILKKIREAVLTVHDHRTRPLHIEFNITDFCNLNCKGCSHYSPLAPYEFEPLDQLENAMKKISRAKNSAIISEIYLIGGETLLYPQIKEAMEMARKYFPTKRISIFTNGVMIPRLKEDLWEVCRRERIEMAITRYPIKFDYDKAEQICRENKVKTRVFGDRSLENSFFKLPLDPEKKQNRWLSHFRCCAFGCVTVDGNRIFPCSQSACIRHFNNKFGTEFKWEDGDYIEVDALKDIKEIKRLRNRPVPFCGYCKHQTFTPYEISKRVKEEWM